MRQNVYGHPRAADGAENSRIARNITRTDTLFDVQSFKFHGILQKVIVNVETGRHMRRTFFQVRRIHDRNCYSPASV